MQKEALSVVTQKILKYEKQYIGQLDSAITISATDLVLELFNASNLYKKNLRDKSVGLKNKRIPSKEINPLDKKKLEDYESFHSNYISILTQGVEDKYYTNILYYFFKYYVLAFNNGDHWMLSGQAVFNGSFLPKDFYDLESIESELDNLKDFYDCQNHVSLRKINPGISFQDFVEIRSYLKPILESLEPYHDYTINDLDLSLKIIEIYDELKIIGNHNKYDTIRNVLTLSENLTNCRKTLAVATSTLFKDKESLVLDESSYPLNLKHVSLINNCFIHEFEFGIQSDISTILLHKYPQGLSIAEFILSSFLESLGESSLNDFEDKFNMIRSVYLRLKIKDTTNIQELNEIVSLKDFAILSFVDKFSNEKKNLNKKLKELLKNSIEISDSELVNLQKESYDTLINEIALFCNIPNIERILENNLNKIEFIITFLHNQGFGGEKVSLNNVDYLKFNEVHKLVLALYNVFDRTTLSLSSGGLLEILSNLSLELKNLEYLYNKNPNYFVELSLSEFATQSESLNLIYEQQCLIDTLTQEISKLTIVSVDIINGIYKSHGFVTNESLRLIVEKIDKGHEDIVKLYQFFELFPKTRSKILFSIDDKLINLLEYFKSTEYFDKHLFIKYAEFQKKYAKLVDLVGTEFEARITKLLGDKSRSFESLQAFIMINLSMYLLEKFIDGKESIL